MLACRCLNASANPPARLGLPPSGVALPLLPPVLIALSAIVLPILTALSLGPGGGAGFFPAGRLVGGAGGAGFARTVGRGRDVPFGTTPFVLVAVEWAKAVGGGGGGAGLGLGVSAWGVRYAEGAHPCVEPSIFLASHQPVEAHH